MRRGRGFGVATPVAVGLSLASAARASAAVRAGTLNLYIGSDVTQAVAAPDVPSLEAAAGNIYREVLASNPKDRLKIQARLIKRQRPDVIGVQEVETVYSGPKGDPARATDVVFDYERLLRKALRKRDVPYRGRPSG
jgi:hypothetical protein